MAPSAPEPLNTSLVVDVLVVINSLAPGGAEVSTVMLAPYLRELGVHITIVTLREAEHEIDDAAALAGVRVIRLGAGGFVSKLRELRSMIRSAEPDVVHTALFDADQLGRLAVIGTGVPVLSSLVSTPYDRRRLDDPKISRWKLRLVQALDIATAKLSRAHFHAVSDGTKTANARALRIALDRVHVAERGRDAERLALDRARRSVVRSDLGCAVGAPVLLSLGRQEYQKGHVDLLAAAAMVRTRHPDLVVLLAGKNGGVTDRIQAMLDSDEDLAQRVRLLGHREDVGDLLAASDMLVISSHFEGTAGVALEALAAGVPVVSTRLSGLEGILTHDRNAILCTPADPASLAAGIERLISDEQLAVVLVAQGQRDFAERFTLEAAAERLTAVYSIVSRRDRMPA